MYLGFDRWHPTSSFGYWWKQINFTEHFHRCCSSKALEWPESHSHPSPGINIDDILFFNVWISAPFLALTREIICFQLNWLFFPHTQAAMSKKKNDAVLCTIQVDDAEDKMNDFLREAAILDEQVCLQPPTRALKVSSLSYSRTGIRH